MPVMKVRLSAECHWKSVNDGWNVPLDQRVAPEDRPGHPSLARRRRVANAVIFAARRKAATMGDPTLRALGAYAVVCYVTALLAGLVVVYGRPLWRRLVMWWEASP